MLNDLVLDWWQRFGNKKAFASSKEVTKLLHRVKEQGGRKQVLVKIILARFWPEGLNLTQLSEIDFKDLFLRPASYKWVSYSAKNDAGELTRLQIIPDQVLAALKHDLKGLFMIHTALVEHPSLPILVLRVQLFDQNQHVPISDLGAQEKIRGKGKLVSRAPFYVLFPHNTSTVIFSHGTDLYAKLIMNSIFKLITLKNNVKMERSEKLPVRNLNSLAVLRGLSRSANALGVWTTYANAKIEQSPLEAPEKHELLQRTAALTDARDKSMLRFKGRRRSASEHLDERFASTDPIQSADFLLKDSLNAVDSITVKLKVRGTDIFGGLHELCDENYIDIDKVPGWLTGENGPRSGIIENGDFHADEIKFY